MDKINISLHKTQVSKLGCQVIKVQGLYYLVLAPPCLSVCRSYTFDLSLLQRNMGVMILKLKVYSAIQQYIKENDDQRQ